jgi:hypothetical protein
VRVHPLAAVEQCIDRGERYTVADLARLTGRSYSRVNTWARGGHLGKSDWESAEASPGGDGVRRRVWTGAVLLGAVAAPAPAQDHERYPSPEATWVLGCRGDDGCGCREHRNIRAAADRLARARAELTPPLRKSLLLVMKRQKITLVEAAAEVGVRPAAAVLLARHDEAFAAGLAKARQKLCRKQPNCGSASGYRTGCRGLSCHTAHLAPPTANPARKPPVRFDETRQRTFLAARERGATLDQAAAEAGVSRESVKRYLRRTRTQSARPAQ